MYTLFIFIQKRYKNLFLILNVEDKLLKRLIRARLKSPELTTSYFIT